MWRSLRQVFSMRNASGNLRLGSIQIAETNEERSTLDSKPCHGKPLCLEHDLSRMEDDFGLMKAIVLHAKNHERKRVARLSYFIGDEKEHEEKNCGTFLDDVKLWFSGVLALSSVLSYRHILYDEDNHFDIKKIPQVVYMLAVQNNPRTTLAMLPLTNGDSHLSMESDDSDSTDAASSFASTSNECTAACHNKIGVKYASKKQYQKAFTMFHLASEQGNSLAHFNLGLCYEHGRGTHQNLSEAADCYKKACDSNHKGACYNLALFYMEGAGGLPKDQNRALELLEKAAQADERKAQSYLGIYYAQQSPEHYSKAVSYLEKAAIKKDNNAEYYLGICYERGIGVERNLVMAGQFYRDAAKHGNIGAQYNVGVFYEHGLGDFPVDHKEALRYYRMAAEAGDADAQHNYELLSKQMDKISTRHDILWTIMHHMTLGNGSISDKGMPRCASSPNIVDNHAEPAHDAGGNALVAF